MKAEVAVVGVGTMGAPTLWELARRGVAAVGFEQFAPGHDRGAAGGDSRVFRTAYLEGAEYVPLLQQALTGWREIERAAGIELLDLCGELNIGGADEPWLQGILATARRFDLPHEWIEREEMARRYPQHHLDEGEVGLLDRSAGVLRCEHAVAAAARLAERDGAALRRASRVGPIEPDGAGVALEVDGETHRFDRVVLAAGPWAAALLPELAPLLEVRRAPMTWYPAFEPEAYRTDRFPAFARASEEIAMFGAPAADGYSVKAATMTAGELVRDPDRLDRSAQGDELTAMDRKVARYLPGLAPAAVRLSIYMDAYTPDHHGLVGSLVAFPQVTVLAGFSGHGFKLAPAFAQAAAEMVVDGETELPIGHLAPSRFG